MDTAQNPSPHAVVIAGGNTDTTIDVPAGAIVIAADSGYDTARTHDIAVSVAVGDMDSISAEGLAHAEANAIVERHPQDKDFTDLELALLAATERGATRVDVYGAEGGRIDHLIGAAITMLGPARGGVRTTWHTADATVHFATPSCDVTIAGQPGDLVSLVPIGSVGGITTTGLAWTLTEDTLPASSSRGLSNRLTSTTASIALHTGTLLVIHQGEHP